MMLEVAGRYGGQVRRIARALRALEPSRLAVGHGPVLEDPMPAIDRAIEVAGRKVGDRSLRAARGVA